MSEFAHKQPYTISAHSTDQYRTYMRTQIQELDGQKSTYTEHKYQKGNEIITWRCIPLHDLPEEGRYTFLTMFTDSDQPEKLMVNLESDSENLVEPRDYREVQAKYKYINGKLTEVVFHGGHISETVKSNSILNSRNFFLESEAFPVVKVNLVTRDISVFEDIRHLLNYEMNSTNPPKNVEMPSSGIVEVSEKNMPNLIVKLTEDKIEGTYTREDHGVIFSSAPLEIPVAAYESVNPNKWYYKFNFDSFSISFVNPLTTFNNQNQNI